jgi:NitT/TauT family transport system substrate-binding protein
VKTYQELLIEARAGGHNAFNELTTRFRPIALSMARRHLGDDSLAEDAVQESFLTVYLKMDQLKNPTAFPSWLKAIVYSVCRRAHNKPNAREISLEEAPAEWEHTRRSDGPEELCIRWQTRKMVLRVLESLPGVAREACRMRYELGLPYRHIAEVLGVPVGTIKRRLHDARKKMVRALRDPSETVLRVGYLPITDHLLAMVSHHRSEQDGYVVRLRKFISWDSLASSLCSGHLDAAFIMVPLALRLRAQGVPLVYVLDAHHGGSSLTVRKAATRPSASDTKDMRMGLPCSVSTHEFMLRSLLKEGKLEGGARWEGFLARYVSPSYMDRLFREKQLDAFFCSEPWGSKAVAEGWGRQLVRSSDVYPDHICCGLAIREEFVSKHPDVSEHYVRLLRDSGDYVDRNPRAGARIQSLYTGVDASLAEHVLLEEGIRFGNLCPDSERLQKVMDVGLSLSRPDPSCDIDAFLHPLVH